MPKHTVSQLAFTPPFELPTEIFEQETYNPIDDLVTVSYNGYTMKVDFGSNDTVVGTSGNDLITVHNGLDTVLAGEGNDTIKDEGNGNDQLFGEGGNDRFVLGAGADLANGGAGIDTVDYTGIDFTVIADLKTGFILAEGIDQVIGVENIWASEWNDTLMGNGGQNGLYGQGGNDKITGGGGRDSLFGGAGNDTINGSGGLYGGTGDDILKSDTRRRGATGDMLQGEDGKDTITGSAGDDTIYGGTGDDVIKGGAGEDLIHGGSGKNILTGGVDRDVFAFQSFGPDHQFDRITDFELNYDKIDLRSIDADPLTEGNQAFNFSNRALRFDDDVMNATGGPELRGSAGRVSSKIDDGYTYIYVQTEDGLTSPDIVLKGEFKLTADHFML